LKPYRARLIESARHRVAIPHAQVQQDMLEIKVNVQVEQLVGALFDGLEPDCRAFAQHRDRAGRGPDVQAESPIAICSKQERRDWFNMTACDTSPYDGMVFSGNKRLEIRPSEMKLRLHTNLLG
jgi:hypothetical protein